MNIDFGTLVEWLLYNALLLVQLSAGTFTPITLTNKCDWSAFVQAFKKQFSTQKNAYYAQVEALSLIKKD